MADSQQTHDDRPTAQRSLFQTPTNPSTRNPSGNASSTNTATAGTDPVQFTDTGDSPSTPHGSSPVATDESSNVGSSTSNDESNTIAQLRAKIQELNDAVLKMSGQISPAMFSPGSSALSMQLAYSREYWARPIKHTIYPGEDAQFASKRAYLQRLNAYLRKSAPIWSVATKSEPCPLTQDEVAMSTLVTLLGPSWTFDYADLSGPLQLLKQHKPSCYNRIQRAMNKGSDTQIGSWNQRNSALYSTICDTLDLTPNGRDLDILDVTEDANGVGIYDLVHARLKQVQTTDPMAKAIQVKMGIDHIKYVPKKHGVPVYFANIKAHRQMLASLPKPKLIPDWEVVAKALHDLPPLHPKFESARYLLELQRQMLNRETTLVECMKVFKDAEADNLLWNQIRKKKNFPKKRRLATNISGLTKRPKLEPGDKPKRNKGKYPPGSCVHHPRSTSHCTAECLNPFGSTSIFALAVDHTNKCAAVKKSLAAGWSPSATNVKVPEGYGNPELPAPGAISANTSKLSKSAVAPQTNTFSKADVEAYHRVTAAISQHNKINVHQRPHIPHQYHTQPTYPHTSQPFSPTNPMVLHRPLIQYNYPAPTPHPNPTTHTRTPPTLTANTAQIQPSQHPPSHITEADLIAAGMQYFRTQAGNQHF